LVFALLAVAPAAVVWLALSSDRPQPPSRAAAVEDAFARARIERLQAEVDEARGDLDRTRADLAALRGAILQMAPPEGPEGKGVEAYLDEYVRSFSGDGRGSEYFRLVVDAYAPALRDGILRVVADPDAPLALRTNLITTLGRTEFRGDGRVIAALVDLLRADERFAQAIAQTLGVIGDARTGATLEAMVPGLQAWGRAHVIAAAVDLSGDGPNGSIVRLLNAPGGEAMGTQLIAMLRGGDDAHAVEALRDASRMAVTVRLAAAQKLGTFRGEPFRRLVDDWLGYETDRGVEAVLRKAREQQDAVPNWHALKATGPPDAVASGDHPNAWATREQDKGREWLEVVYDPPRRASGVRIFEVNVPGGVVEIETVDEGNGRRSVWKGTDPTATPGVFEVSFAATSYKVRSVRIILDTSRRTGWEEIDAVELVGPDGRAWAAGASASSSYGQG
jgi:hypothetical protein